MNSVMILKRQRELFYPIPGHALLEQYPGRKFRPASVLLQVFAWFDELPCLVVHSDLPRMLSEGHGIRYKDEWEDEF